ncbi:class I adenylate-forming enzyme family protein [Streptomyces uncialis]|uniref:class I adenylate-forming enzyme family protein n=1 Tax=Streptomyces uncialis TaxID=1048205 RepID=UPI003811D47F
MTGAWPTNMPRTLHYPDVGVDAVLAGAARAYADRTALRDGDDTLTYAELHDRALRVARGLRERRIAPGDTVALHMPNSIWFVVAYYGALCAGAAVAPLNPAQPPLALRRQLADCDAKAVVAHPATASAIAEAAAPSVRFTVCVPPTTAGPARSDVPLPDGLVPLSDLLACEPLEDGPVSPDSVAHLQLTGGTTGVSKAVRVLHRNLVANALQVACWRSSSLPFVDAAGGVGIAQVPEAASEHSLVPGECVALGVAPLFHGLGLVGHNTAVLLGTAVHLTGRFNAETFLADIERYRVTQLTGSPAMYYALLRSPAIGKHDLSSVRLITSGAAPIDTTALRRLDEAFPRGLVSEGYGLSEATMGVSSGAAHTDHSAPVGSVGVPIFDTEIEIRPPGSAGAVPQGETGEVWVRGPQVADGYQGHPELTAAQFVDGWLRTGDMGYVDGDGFLYLVGRAKDMLIYKGYNVYPQPLEEILCSHPAIAQAAVVGSPDDTAGEIPVGFVVLRPGSVGEAARGQEFADEVIAYVAERVAPYQRVRALHVVESLPATDTGKVRKTALRERLGNGTSTSD